MKTIKETMISWIQNRIQLIEVQLEDAKLRKEEPELIEQFEKALIEYKNMLENLLFSDDYPNSNF